MPVSLPVVIAALAVAMGAPVKSAEPRTGSRNELASTVQSIASMLRDSYVYPEVGERMAADILARLERGEYDGISDDRTLAERLTADLRALSDDKHLGVVHTPRAGSPGPAGPMRSPDDLRRENYYFRKAELLQGNIGYLRFDLFVADDRSKETASAALAFLANADALIIDLRRNGGGSPDMIRYITSYFFDEPTLLNVMLDRDGKVVSEYYTLESIPGKRFAPDLPVYILTSNYTFSGAEEFSYNLKHLNRAIVIGETTGGGAHPVRGERVNERYTLRVPFMRARNPISGTNWEGTGVRPHIEVSADDALDRALREAREAVFGEKSIREAGWPRTRAGAVAAAFFEAYGDDDSMSQFSKTFRAESARGGRSDADYAAFWRDYAEKAVPISYVSRGEHELTVTASITRQDGRETEARFRFEFEPRSPHGLRAIHVSAM